MPIKELVTIATAFVLTLGVLSPKKLNQIKQQIIKECATTKNWGSPNIFKKHRF